MADESGGFAEQLFNWPSLVGKFLQGYGWTIVSVAVAVYVVWSKLGSKLEDKLEAMRSSRPSVPLDPSRIAAARERQQQMLQQETAEARQRAEQAKREAILNPQPKLKMRPSEDSPLFCDLPPRDEGPSRPRFGRPAPRRGG